MEQRREIGGRYDEGRRLGTTRGSRRPGDAVAPTGHGVLSRGALTEALRSRSALRRAILLREILDQPRALQSPDGVGSYRPAARQAAANGQHARREGVTAEVPGAIRRQETPPPTGEPGPGEAAPHAASERSGSAPGWGLPPARPGMLESALDALASSADTIRRVLRWRKRGA